jgi:tRNA dimethylallyltransferase
MNDSMICIMGPTAVGKTELAMKLYDKFDCELISVDSAMIYRNMDIGSAKPTKQQLRAYPHHLIDIINPDERYSVANFCKDVNQLIESCQKRGKIPLLVGGTMMYYKALQQGLSCLPSASPALRLQLLEKAASIGWPAMHQMLARVDSTTAAKIHPNDSQRIGRALEVYHSSGKPLSFYWQQTSDEKMPRFVNISLMPQDRAKLHRLIEQRFMQMIENGFIEEVATVQKCWHLNISMPSLRCVGYRQVWQYLQDEIDHETMLLKAIAATRQLAKRQMTWLRRFPNANHFDPWQHQLEKKVFDFIKKSSCHM